MAHALKNIAGRRYPMDQRILYGRISVVALRCYERRRFFGLYAARSPQTPRGVFPLIFLEFKLKLIEFYGAFDEFNLNENTCLGIKFNTIIKWRYF